MKVNLENELSSRQTSENEPSGFRRHFFFLRTILCCLLGNSCCDDFYRHYFHRGGTKRVTNFPLFYKNFLVSRRIFQTLWYCCLGLNSLRLLRAVPCNVIVSNFCSLQHLTLVVLFLTTPTSGFRIKNVSRVEQQFSRQDACLHKADLGYIFGSGTIYGPSGSPESRARSTSSRGHKTKQKKFL